jgi:type I restriction enzyme, S subunit
LAPINEQRRIVAKVKELMALCDELEREEINHLKSHQLLVETLLGTLTNATDADDFQQAWDKLEAHFDDLFTTEDSIDQLKQTVLQLAVMGKLVPQDSNDEPASELLKRIEKEKEKLMKEGKIKKAMPLREITECESHISIPFSWKWSRVGDVAILLGGFANQSSDFKKDGTCQVIKMGNIRPDLLRLNESPAFISEGLARETTEYQIQVNDILVLLCQLNKKGESCI